MRDEQRGARNAEDDAEILRPVADEHLEHDEAHCVTDGWPAGPRDLVADRHGEATVREEIDAGAMHVAEQTLDFLHTSPLSNRLTLPSNFEARLE